MTIAQHFQSLEDTRKLPTVGYLLAFKKIVALGGAKKENDE